MNYLQRKKLAFMKLLDNIKTALGYPVIIKDAKEGNAVDYTIYGNTVEENLLIHPFVDTTKTVNGITFTDNGDGTITANGTATGDARFILRQSADIPKDGTYFLSGCPANGGTSKYYLHANAALNGTYVKGFFDEGKGIAVDLRNINYDKISVIAITIKSGITADNMVFEPKLISRKSVGEKTESGNYKIPLSISKGNILPYPYYNSNRVYNGITYTDNGDGTITANGTATEHSHFYAKSADSFTLENKVYTFSGCPKGGSTSAYYQYIGVVNNGNFVKSINDTGDGVIADFTTLEFTGTTIGISIRKGTTVDNMVFGLKLEEEPTKINIYHTSQLAEGESINYKTDKLPELPLHEGYNAISADTTVPPSNIEIKYS